MRPKFKEGATNAPGISSADAPGEEVATDQQGREIKTASDLQAYIRNIAKDSANFKGLDTKEISAIADILKLMLDKSREGSTGNTLSAVDKIIIQKTKAIKTDSETNTTNNTKEPITEADETPLKLDTYGDLKNLIKSISSGEKKKKIVSKAGEIALDQLLGFIPGASNAKSVVDLIKTATKKPDKKKTNAVLDKFDIDDNTSAIVDDTVENAFIDAVAKEIENEPDDKQLEPDYNMNAKLANWLKAKYSDHFVAPDKKVQSEAKSDHEIQFCPQCLAEYITERWNKLEEAEYKGRTVPLGKPMKGDKKKFKVYVKNQKGNVVKVEFGQPGVKIKKNNPARRKSFRARHHCDTNPGPRWKARYWSCRKW